MHHLAREHELQPHAIKGDCRDWPVTLPICGVQLMEMLHSQPTSEPSNSPAWLWRPTSNLACLHIPVRSPTWLQNPASNIPKLTAQATDPQPETLQKAPPASTEYELTHPVLGQLVKVFLCQNKTIKTGTGDYFLECTDSNKNIQIMKNQGSITPLKETNKAPITGLNSGDLLTDEQRIQNNTPWKKFSELQENRNN